MKFIQAEDGRYIGVTPNTTFHVQRNGTDKYGHFYVMHGNTVVKTFKFNNRKAGDALAAAYKFIGTLKEDLS